MPIVRQCALVGVSRSSLYYRPHGASEEDLSLMREIDRQYLETPFYGSRRMKAWLERQGIPVSRKRVQRLMRAIYRRPRTSRPVPGVRVYPYLLGKAEITRPKPGVGRRHHLSAHGPWLFSTWWQSWTGTAGMSCPGDCPTLWRPAFAPRL